MYKWQPGRAVSIRLDAADRCFPEAWDCCCCWRCCCSSRRWRCSPCPSRWTGAVTSPRPGAGPEPAPRALPRGCRRSGRRTAGWTIRPRCWPRPRRCWPWRRRRASCLGRRAAPRRSARRSWGRDWRGWASAGGRASRWAGTATKTSPCYEEWIWIEFPDAIDIWYRAPTGFGASTGTSFQFALLLRRLRRSCTELFRSQWESNPIQSVLDPSSSIIHQTPNNPWIDCWWTVSTWLTFNCREARSFRVSFFLPLPACSCLFLPLGALSERRHWMAVTSSPPVHQWRTNR